MSNGTFPDRLTQLKNRWEADPSSRVFLQLAEEYRHQGRLKEALDVLDRGLKEHAGYLSALVAKGRCHLELGEPEAARGVLERVVKQDATQMVAIKLLVRAYLDTGEADRARDRLDLYSLLNDSDPEIEELRRRLHAMERPPQAEKPVSPPLDRPAPKAAAPPPPPLRAVPPPADVFDLGAPAASPPPPPRAGGDVFELDLAAPRAAPIRQDEPFADLWAPPAAPAPAAAAAEAAAAEAVTATAVVVEEEPEEESEPADVLFPGLASRESRRRYLDSLAAEGLFLLDLTPAAPPAAAPIPSELRMQEPFGEPILARAAAPELLPLEPPFAFPSEPLAAEPAMAFSPEPLPLEPPPAFPPEPLPLEPLPALRRDAPVGVREPFGDLDGGASPAPPRPPKIEAPAPSAPPAAEPAATVTLGELYLKQGHLAEADRIFQEILRREPDHPAAQEGLARLSARRQERRPVEARELLAGYEPGAESGPAETAARKTFLLNSYLKRLRRGSQRGVS